MAKTVPDMMQDLLTKARMYDDIVASIKTTNEKHITKAIDKSFAKVLQSPTIAKLIEEKVKVEIESAIESYDLHDDDALYDMVTGLIQDTMKAKLGFKDKKRKR